LAVTSAARNPALPEVPTLAESGLQGYECSLWQAIVAPAAASPALITRLNREIGAVLDDPELRAAFVKNGIEAQASSPAELGARINADAKKWRDVIISAGIRAN
jgi:tripartite-type tricarboxylate transporter receptor subunit TctC